MSEAASSVETPTPFGNPFRRAIARAEASVVGLTSPRGSATSGTVWNDEGVIVTSHRGTLGRRHHEATWTLTGPDQRQREVESIARDPATDVAIFRTSSEGLVAIDRTSELPELGTLALALARPGWQLRASLRILGLVGPGFRTAHGGRVDAWLESDRALPNGFSGGPLVDVEGRMLGLDSRGLVRGADLAIPNATLERVVAELLTHGQVRHGWLGVSLVPVVIPTQQREALGLAQRSAVLVAGLEEGSPAAAGGVLIGDVILELGGKPADDPGSLREALLGKAERELALTVLRGGQRLDLRVTPSEQPGRA
ncbi:S1C family serine protease [Nannocystaceae bacterium ST9]